MWDANFSYSPFYRLLPNVDISTHIEDDGKGEEATLKVGNFFLLLLLLIALVFHLK